MNLPNPAPYPEGSYEELYLMESMRIAYNGADPLLDADEEVIYGSELPYKDQFESYSVVRFKESVLELWVILSGTIAPGEAIRYSTNVTEVAQTIYNEADEPTFLVTQMIDILRELKPRVAYDIIETLWGPEDTSKQILSN
jgi:hypothetical protein